MASALVPGTLEQFRKSFLAAEPGFVSFANPGEAYLDNERRYKIDLLKAFDLNIRPLLLNPAEAAAIPGALDKVLGSALPTLNAPQNMIHHWARGFLRKMENGYAVKVGQIFQQLVDESSALEDRLQEFAHSLPHVVDEAYPQLNGKRSWNGTLLIFATFILAYMWPEKYSFWRVELGNFISQNFLGRKVCTEGAKGRLTFAQECVALFELAQTVREELADWHPNDFIDVQSFFWVNFQYKNTDWSGAEDGKTPVSTLQKNDDNPSTEPALSEIAIKLVQRGLKISPQTLRRYHCALKSRKFVILAGISGIGKTWLAEAYADAIGAKCQVVAVAPNWNSDEDLLGFYNPVHQQYNLTPASQFLEMAQLEYKEALAAGRAPKPFHLILDEMNLARIEHYFARFLSAMERRERGAALELGPDRFISLTPNVYFIGTVNMDETTHGFADKVFDRAQLIEMPLEREHLLAHMTGFPYAQFLIQVWDIISETAPFAFRTLDDIAAYVTEAQGLGVAWEKAVDEQITQKILPRLRSSSPDFGIVLEKLATLMEREQFELSAAKLRKMGRTFASHGFASYFA